MVSKGLQRRKPQLITPLLRVSPCRQLTEDHSSKQSPPAKTAMSSQPVETPSTCQNTAATEHSHHWGGTPFSSNDGTVTPTPSPSKQYRVLFADAESLSPLPSTDCDNEYQRASVSPTATAEDWRDQVAKHDPDTLCGNLSMDSSLSSTSSLYNDQDDNASSVGSSQVSRERWRGVWWKFRRPRMLFLLLTTLGLTFSSFTFLISTMIRHPSADSSEAHLRSQFLPRHVRKTTRSAVSLTALAQARSLNQEKNNSAPKKRKQIAKERPLRPKGTRIDIPSVKLPVDWPKTSRKDRQELALFHREQGASVHAPRVVFLSDPQLSSQHPPHRRIELYPADFTDKTQLYPVLDSGDERIKGMEIRKPYTQGECVPMSDWQTTFHPSCNVVHELGLGEMGENSEISFDLFGKKGFWRNAWRVEANKGNDVFVLKTLKVKHNFEEAHFEHDRVDAVAMERLTGSPHVIDIFGYCGHSVMTEYADGKRLGAVADRARGVPLARLKMALDIAEGLADVHGIDGDEKVSFVHLDINPANVVIVGGKLKLNDFNIGIIRRWNTTSNAACGFPAQFPNPQWRSPEEARGEQNLSEKVDIFSMGHIFYRLISGAEPWNRLEPGGKPSKAVVNKKVQQGILPTIPDAVAKSNDPEIVAIRDAMLQCYEKDPQNRPSARAIAMDLRQRLSDLLLSRETFES